MYKHIYDTLAKHWCANGSIYFYSDPHFGDLDSYKYFRFPELFTADCDIAETIKALDKMQVDSINKVCTKNDCLVILGDVGNIDCVKKLKAGYKVLIMGNHDAGASNYKRKCYKQDIDCAPYQTKSSNDIWFEALKLFNGNEEAQYDYVCKEKALVRKRALEDLRKNLDFEELSRSTYYDAAHSPFEFWEASYDNKLFDEVYEGPLFISDRILLSHEPIEYPFALNIHGHDHSNRELTTSPHLNVCAEHIGYTPVCLSTLIKNGALKDISNIHRNCIEVARAKK